MVDHHDTPRMRTSLRMTLLVGALLALAAPMAAQRTEDAAPVGARVRAIPLNASTGVVTGRLTAIGGDSLTVAPDGGGALRRLGWADLVRLDRFDGTRTGRQAFGRGAKRGALVGLAATGILGVVALVAARGDCNDCFISTEAVVIGGGVALTTVSTVVGGVIGLGHRERWVRVPRP